MRAREIRIVVWSLVVPVLGALAAFAAAEWWWPFPLEALVRPPARIVDDAGGEPLRIFLAADHRWRLAVGPDEVSPELLEAIVIAEDRWFRWHPGVNPAAILRAAVTNLRAGRIVSGGSTIPMQIARMAEPGPRTVRSKLREALRALQLERRFSKDELLAIYLRLAPFGANLEGVGAAAYFYFGKRPRELLLGEAALLAALPRAPNAYDPVRHPDAARHARDRVLDQLESSGRFPRDALAAARQQPVPTTRRRPPFAGPHFTQLVADRHAGERVLTTLDRRVQRVAESRVHGRILALRAEGIREAAAVVVENDSRAVRAMVGSSDFFGPRGQVNGATARRSPGSTLKPFLYARAFDEGSLIPDSWVLDVPTDFSGYVAENYDGRYRGRVTVREALIDSLNASAVRVLSGMGLASFVSFLRRGGLETLDRTPAEYGLPLILGSGEVTLLDLTNLYATLAEGGLHRPVRLVEAPAAEPTELFSPEAAALVTRTLSEVKRPDFPGAWELARDVPQVAWKTGTSYGHRDAWAVGYSARYTIGVWVGNFDGRPEKGISGTVHAGPLLFDLFRAIEGGGARIPERRHPVLRTIEVCSVSHELPGPWCAGRTSVTTIPGRSRLAPCRWHRRVFVDPQGGEILAGSCVGTRPYRPAVLTVFPPELVAWWRAQGEPIAELPPRHPDCRDRHVDGPPQIVSPGAATPYRIRNDAPGEFQKIPLVARVSPAVARLWWYRDGELIAAGAPAARLFLAPERGSYRLVVVDDAGRSDRIEYRVD